MTEQPRPLAVRLEEGAILPGAVEAEAARLELEFCDVDGFGELAWIELQTAGASEPRRFEGPLDLLTLRGRLRRVGDVVLADFACTVSRSTDNGIQLLGGQLVGARTNFVELRMVPLANVDDGDRPATRPPTPDEPAVAAPARTPATTGKPAAASGPALGDRWAAALEESKRQERKARSRSWEDDDGLLPTRGDVVNHRQFGRCQVIRVDDEHITLRKPDGRTVQLGLAILRFTNAPPDGGATAYDVVVRRG
jgi:predicted DNA-binding protein with PD1-like motif